MPELEPDDLYIAGEETRHDLGNQLVRYFLTPLALFGVGTILRHGG